MNESIIVDAHGKGFRPERDSPCPKCGRAPDKRIPSASFGSDIYLVCQCGYEFGKRLTCQKTLTL